MIRAGVFALMLPAAASAQVCGPHDDVAKQLRERYGEVIQCIGVDVGGTLVTVWSNAVTGTWTITGTNGAGITCLIGAGNGFEVVAEPQGIDG